MKYLSYSYILLLIFASCTKDLDLDWPSEPPQLVLNGILHPDSTIQVALSTTIPLTPQSTDFPIIENATVSLYEDDELLGDLVFRDSVYVLDYHPKAGRQYTVQANVPGYLSLSASDIVPAKPDVAACYLAEERNTYFAFPIPIRTRIVDPLESNYYWLYSTISNYRYVPSEERYCDSLRKYLCPQFDSTTLVNTRMGLISESPIIDRFNAFTDNTSYGETTYKTGYIRFNDLSNNGDALALEVISASHFGYDELPNLTAEQALTLHIISSSTHYDRHLKSSLIDHLNNDYYDNPNPFSQSTQIYSNIENGTGIFAAHNSTSIRIEQHPCE